MLFWNALKSKLKVTKLHCVQTCTMTQSYQSWMNVQKIIINIVKKKLTSHIDSRVLEKGFF